MIKESRHHQPTPEEMRAIHAYAHQLRAEATRDFFRMIGTSFAGAAAFIGNLFAGLTSTAAK